MERSYQNHTSNVYRSSCYDKKKKNLPRDQFKPYSSTLDLVQIKAGVTPGESSSKRRKAMNFNLLYYVVLSFIRYTHGIHTSLIHFNIQKDISKGLVRLEE